MSVKFLINEAKVGESYMQLKFNLLQTPVDKCLRLNRHWGKGFSYLRIRIMIRIMIRMLGSFQSKPTRHFREANIPKRFREPVVAAVTNQHRTRDFK